MRFENKKTEAEAKRRRWLFLCFPLSLILTRWSVVAWEMYLIVTALVRRGTVLQPDG